MTNTETSSPKCGRCGTALGPDAPEGLCPRCLLALNLASQTEAPAAEAGPGGTKVMPPPVPSLEEIARLFPQLEIQECLGRGGMGVVYKARQPRLERLVALKIISPGKEKDPRFAERFAREARALAHLNHQSIVTIYDFGETSGLFYLLMEYVDGTSLRSLLQTRKLAPEAALKIVPAICDALQYAHQQGIVHRDIKPENILLDKQGRVKIADFGIAKVVGGDSPPERLTGEQQVVGTPNYMAPEQVEKPASVDHRADIYSLGVVFYEMLTGELPLGKFQPPSNKVHIDVRLDEIVLHALEKEPERRYQQAVEVKTALDTLGGPPAVPQARAQPIAALDPWAQVRGPAIGLIVTAILNWVAIPLLVLAWIALVNTTALASAWMILFPLSAFVTSGVILVAGLKMKGLEAWRLALAGSVLAMLITPGNLVGLPVGIWSLVVLLRRETRLAFAAKAAGRLGPPPARGTPASGGAAKWAIAAGLAGLLLVLAIPVGAVFLSIALPAYSRARAAHAAKLPSFAVTGEVTDAATGRPIAGARVADNFYGAKPDRAPQEAWTDSVGSYRLMTWPEEHTVAASAPGYQTQLRTLVTGPLGQANSAPLNFALQREAGGTEAEASADQGGAVSPAARSNSLAYSWRRTGPAGDVPTSTTIPAEPQVLRVAADGSGTHTNLQAAIDAASAGTVIHIGPGRYETAVFIDKPLTLVGESWNQTIIGPAVPWVEAPPDARSELDRRLAQAGSDAERQRLREEFASGYASPVLRIRGARPVLIENLKLTLPGLPPAGRLISSSVVEILGGTVTLRDCVIAGSPGNGVSIAEGAAVTITNCLVAAAWNSGIRLSRSSQPGLVRIASSDVRNCYYAGLSLGAETVEIRRCRVSGAAWHGIRYDDVSPLVEECLISANARSGVYASGRTAARIKGNVFWKNEMNGLSAWFQNRDEIRQNTFAANGREGLAILGASTPVIRQNVFWSNPIGLFAGDVSGNSPSAKASGRLNANVADCLFWTNRVNASFSGAALLKDPSLTNRFTVAFFNDCAEQDPHFKDPARGDFTMRGGNSRDAGALHPLSPTSPWPLQPEEKAIIPDGDTRDSRAWKRPATQP